MINITYEGQLRTVENTFLNLGVDNPVHIAQQPFRNFVGFVKVSVVTTGAEVDQFSFYATGGNTPFLTSPYAVIALQRNTEINCSYVPITSGPPNYPTVMNDIITVVSTATGRNWTFRYHTNSNPNSTVICDGAPMGATDVVVSVQDILPTEFCLGNPGFRQ